MAEEKPIGKKLRKFSMETRLKSTKDLRKKLLDKFGDYIKAVIVWGSLTRGDFTGKSDVDVYIIFDDTKASIQKFNEIRDRIDEDVSKLAGQTDPRLHPQPILALTEFWDGIRACHPLFYNIVREGYAVYDTGFFIPLRKLLEWGKFPATTEAAELRMESVPKRIERVKNVKLYMIAEDLYQAMIDAAQAVLMYLGIPPPAPKPLPREVRKHLVENKLLEEEYAKTLEDVIVFRKAVEHKELKEIAGADVDKWIKRAEKYVNRLEKLLKELEAQKKASDVEKNYEVMIKASVATLKALKKLPEEPKELPQAFKTHLIDSGLVNPVYEEIFGKVLEMRKMLAEKQIEKVSDRDVYRSKEYVRRFVADVRRILQEKAPEIKEDREEEAEEKMEEAKEIVKTVKEIEKLPKAETEACVKEEKIEKKLEKVEKKLEKAKKEHKEKVK